MNCSLPLFISVRCFFFSCKIYLQELQRKPAELNVNVQVKLTSSAHSKPETTIYASISQLANYNFLTIKTGIARFWCFYVTLFVISEDYPNNILIE